jgi:hypothetical protein
MKIRAIRVQKRSIFVDFNLKLSKGRPPRTDLGRPRNMSIAPASPSRAAPRLIVGTIACKDPSADPHAHAGAALLRNRFT